jgi:hypothetical protein
MKLNLYHKILLMSFVVTLPLCNPLVHCDGMGYYAYVRSLVVQHNLRFEADWLNLQWPYPAKTVDAEGHINTPYTLTGHIPNHYSVGPSMLWAPFLIPVHTVMVGLAKGGRKVKTDGFSLSYILTAALATALYGFLGLCISFRLARLCVQERWAFFATLSLWFASSLPVYMYFDPFYPHAQSVFGVAVFLWYWHRTRPQRTMAQWATLGLLSGLVLDIYYLNIAILSLPLLESMRLYWRAWRAPGHDWEALRRHFLANLIFLCMTVVAFMPTLITRQIIYGNPLDFGYEPSSWFHPALWQPLLSSNHGLLSWTPIIAPALMGLFLLRRYDRELATYSLAAFAILYYIVACHPAWHGLSSFGNRFFISLTPLFILGLAVFLQEASFWFTRARGALATSALVIGALILWNLAFIFQWGTGLVPHIGSISWKQMAYNQVMVVPARLGSTLKAYFSDRSGLMKRIQLQDLQHWRGEPMAGSDKSR